MASGKIFKKAVLRNEVRRRMSEAFRPFLESVPPGYDIIFVARPEVEKADFEDLRSSLQHLIEKMPKELEKPWERRPKPPRSRKGIIAYAKQVGAPRPPGKNSQ